LPDAFPHRFDALSGRLRLTAVEGLVAWLAQPCTAIRWVRADEASDLLRDERSGAAKEPAPITVVVPDESDFVPDDGAVVKYLLRCDICCLRIGLTGNLPRPRFEAQFDGAGSWLAEVQELVPVPTNYGILGNKGLRVRMH
jgi:hypothetical protein